MKPRRALISVYDKTGLVELAKEFKKNNIEMIATGSTRAYLQERGIATRSVEEITGKPEAFHGRVKTLAYELLAGVLYKRDDPADCEDLSKLNLLPIDIVVVNFYPFEKEPVIEQVDIGGPTLVRAAAKNGEHVLVLTDPIQYPIILSELKSGIHEKTLQVMAAHAWERIAQYDKRIADELGQSEKIKLRYGENPHQYGSFEASGASPILWQSAWSEQNASGILSYNNILDGSSGYQLVSDLSSLFPKAAIAAIIKHNGPCGVAVHPKMHFLDALKGAWDGDPVSAFGGVVILNHALREDEAHFLADHFIEVVVAPGLKPDDPAVKILQERRKKIKWVPLAGLSKKLDSIRTEVVGGVLTQSTDLGVHDPLNCVTQKSWNTDLDDLARFGIIVTRSLRSNAVGLFNKNDQGTYMLVGSGQGQPNRIEALEWLAIPRAKRNQVALENCVLVSDAFFPFPDGIEIAAQNGIRWVVQPGGSIKDKDVIEACNRNGVSMVFTGIRHFRH